MLQQYQYVKFTKQWRRLIRKMIALIGVLSVGQMPPSVDAEQVHQVLQWQYPAGNSSQFEVASVRQDTSETFKPPNLALTADDGWGPSSSLFYADYPLTVYIEFAWKLWLSPAERQIVFARLPKWVSTDNYEIRARMSGIPTKDQVRLMMQSLLKERFKLEIHFESRQLPVYGLVLAKAGARGPKLIQRGEGNHCEEQLNPQSTHTNAEQLFPTRCGVYSARMTSQNTYVLASRNTTIPLLAESLPSFGSLDRPVVDQTGLSGSFDVSIEWTRGLNKVGVPGDQAVPESPGTTFEQALKDQLGLRLEPTRVTLRIPNIDHVERPSDN